MFLQGKGNVKTYWLTHSEEPLRETTALAPLWERNDSFRGSLSRNSNYNSGELSNENGVSDLELQPLIT